ncbi:AsmA family protein [Terrihabitans rhizophilus]|uniref:AsmA family protein n=1 Tax=Terrihabitans rhizophilus TaxID=3092662 RepID=A0ABU4RPK5_9HYPH|nr:AsmA family protein [Terrihabitans sp. PJ23]MDX6805575.1 AsmA family protein [Terrihabitans sp. PJ23]
MTGLGIALVVALIAALVGPFFVDWTHYRSSFEEQASRLAGVPVKVRGEVDARLLPSPRISFGDVRVGEDARPLLDARSFTLDLALAPLMSGQYRVTRLSVAGVDARLDLDAEGRPILPARAAMAAREDLDRVSLESFEVRDARLLLTDMAAKREINLRDLLVTGQADSLRGPLKMEATGLKDETPFTLRLSTGGFDQGAGRITLALRSPAVPDLDVDGSLKIADGLPVLSGRFTAAPAGGEAATVWRVSGQVEADARRVGARGLDLLYGPEGRGLRLVGSGEWRFGAQPGARLDLTAKQFDLDRALMRPEDAPALPPHEALAAYFDTLPEPPELSFPVEASVAIDSVILGGDVVSGAQLELASASEGWAVRSLDMKLPGGALAASRGVLAVNAWSAPSYTGSLSVDAPNMPSLVRWLRGAETGGARPDLGVRKVAIAGQLQARPGAFSVDKMRLALDGMAADGAFSWSQDDDGEASLKAQLKSDQLDLDALEVKRFARWVEESAGGMLRLDLTAKVGQLTFAGVETRDLDADLRLDGNGADIRRFVAGNLGGARLEAAGRVGFGATAGGNLKAQLDARSLDGVTRMMRALAVPAALTDRLATRMDVLVPAKLALDVTSRDGGVFEGTASGTLAGSDFDLRLRSGLSLASLQDMQLTASSRDATRLLQQIGLPVAGVEPEGRGALRTSLVRGTSGLSAEGDLEAIGGRAQFRGVLGDDFVLNGRAEAQMEDAGRLGVLLGRLQPLELPAIPVTLTGTLRRDASVLTASGMTGFVAGRPVSGTVAYGPSQGLTGDVKIASISLPELLGVALGPVAVAAADVSWPTGTIETGLLSGLKAKLRISSDALGLPAGYVAGRAALTLAVTPNEFVLQDVSGVLAGGSIAGELTVRKAGQDASISVRGTLKDAALAGLVWTSRGSPVASGVLDVTADAVGSGRTLAAMASGLTGSGTFELRNARLKGVDAGAFQRVTQQVQAQTTPPDAQDVAQRFAHELGLGDLQAADLTSAFTMASGVLRVSNAAIASPSATGTASAELDLVRGGLAAELTLRPAGAEAIPGASAPQAVLLFSGPIAAPQRVIDTTTLTSFLTVQALDREMRRVEKMERDKRERARREAEEARIRAITESTGQVPLGELPPPVDLRPPPAPAPPPQAAPAPVRRQVLPFDLFRRSEERVR